jgi:hypothetical protein
MKQSASTALFGAWFMLVSFYFFFYPDDGGDMFL